MTERGTTFLCHIKAMIDASFRPLRLDPVGGRENLALHHSF